MEPRIQYAQTKDGVSIAFWTLGDGIPIVRTPAFGWSHLQLEWQNTPQRSMFEREVETRRLVRYDSRGSGLSERDVSEFSLDSFVTDLEAVVDHLGLERFVLSGPVFTGPVAIAYAARHPERVSHLTLWCTWARSPEWPAQLQAALSLRDKDWELFTETLFHAVLGFEAGEVAHRFAMYVRESITQDKYDQILKALMDFDVREDLPRVRCPTLVSHRRQLPWPSLDVARGLASKIPGARLALLEGDSAAPAIGDLEAVLAAIDEFLGEGEEAAATAELPEGMAVILFADIAGSTALTERMGDAAFRAKARELDGALRAIILECSGTPVEGKVLGDGVLAVFTSARQAIGCALRCNAASEPLGLQLHLGIHAGDVIREGNNVYGGAVNIAARIAGASAPGEVLVSDTVRGLARTSAGVSFEDRGEQSLKGVSEPVRLFAVREGARG